MGPKIRKIARAIIEASVCTVVMAMLSSLEINNFKGIKTGAISDLAQVNVLVGRNNSGKSTVLDALLLMRCAFAVTDYMGRSGLDQLIKRRIERPGKAAANQYRELHYMLNVNDRISLQAGFDNNTRVVQEWNRDLSQLVLHLLKDGSETDTRQRRIGVGHGNSVENFANREEWERIAQNIGHDDATLLATGHLLDPSTLRTPFLEGLWERIVIDRRDARLRDMISNIFKLDVEGFSLMPFSGHNRLVALLPERSVAVDWLGDGARYALNVLALGILLEGTVLMVEEPETHQHPESLRLLTQTLFELASKQHLQLFLTTHSLELITYALEAAEQKGMGLTIHHVRLSEDGTFDARAIPRPDAKVLMDIGHDIRMQDKYIGAT